MSHVCKALVVHCMDYRFNESLFAYLQKLNLFGNADLVGWAGSAQPFLDDEGVSFVMKQVRLSHTLHQSSEVHLIQHVDCGAYGGSSTFGNLSKERAIQAAEIEKARKVITKEFPQMTVIGHLAEIKDGSVSYIQLEERVTV